MGYLLAYVDQLGEGDYSPETWSNLQTELAYSQGVYDNPHATQIMITLATNRIQTALDEMNYTYPNNADDLLESMLLDVSGFNEQLYTSESCQVLQDAIDAGQSILNDPLVSANDKLFARYQLKMAEYGLVVEYEIPYDAKLTEIIEAIETEIVDFVPDYDSSMEILTTSLAPAFDSIESIISRGTFSEDWGNQPVDRVYLVKAKPRWLGSLESVMNDELSFVQENPDLFPPSADTIANGTIKISGDYIFLILTGDTPEAVQAIVDIIDRVLV